MYWLFRLMIFDLVWLWGLWQSLRKHYYYRTVEYFQGRTKFFRKIGPGDQNFDRASGSIISIGPLFSGEDQNFQKKLVQGTKIFSEKIGPGTKIFRTKIPVTGTELVQTKNAESWSRNRLIILLITLLIDEVISMHLGMHDLVDRPLARLYRCFVSRWLLQMMQVDTYTCVLSDQWYGYMLQINLPWTG